eukprot:c20240_g1_i2.p1 GENE.c20240_g1_i2~~c20240_g1_i2.p1  ORF type:complete len:1003 (+),score=88.65 c20240_g1_i2:287-3295(+)
MEWNDDTMIRSFQQIARAQNPSIVTIVALGGWLAGSTKFSQLAATSATRTRFARSAITFARTYDFDGIDIDWEFPALSAQGGKPEDKINLTELMKTLRQEINTEVLPQGKSRIHLSLAVSANNDIISNGYEMAQLHPLVDWLGLMTYDLNVNYLRTQAHTAIRGAQYSVNSALQFMASLGVPPEKIVLGMATYGRSFSLPASSDVNCSMGAPSDGPGLPGDFTNEAGFLAYYEVSQLVARQKFETEVKTDIGTQTSNVCDRQQLLWTTYDSLDTVQAKVDIMVDRNLQGLMIWSIDLDIFNEGYPVVTAATQRVCERVPTTPLCAQFLSTPTLITALDLHPGLGTFQGVIFFQPPLVRPTSTQGYRVYLANATKSNTLLATVPLTASTPVDLIAVSVCQPINLYSDPATKTHIAVTSFGASGESGSSGVLLDRALPVDASPSAFFRVDSTLPPPPFANEQHPAGGGVWGFVTFQRVVDELLNSPLLIQGYRIYTASSPSVCDRASIPQFVVHTVHSTIREFAILVANPIHTHVHIVSFNLDGDGAYRWIKVPPYYPSTTGGSGSSAFGIGTGSVSTCPGRSANYTGTASRYTQALSIFTQSCSVDPATLGVSTGGSNPTLTSMIVGQPTLATLTPSFSPTVFNYQLDLSALLTANQNYGDVVVSMTFAAATGVIVSSGQTQGGNSLTTQRVLTPGINSLEVVVTDTARRSSTYRILIVNPIVQASPSPSSSPSSSVYSSYSTTNSTDQGGKPKRATNLVIPIIVASVFGAGILAICFTCLHCRFAASRRPKLQAVSINPTEPSKEFDDFAQNQDQDQVPAPQPVMFQSNFIPAGSRRPETQQNQHSTSVVRVLATPADPKKKKTRKRNGKDQPAEDENPAPMSEQVELHAPPQLPTFESQRPLDTRQPTSSFQIIRPIPWSAPAPQPQPHLLRTTEMSTHGGFVPAGQSPASKPVEQPTTSVPWNAPQTGTMQAMSRLQSTNAPAAFPSTSGKNASAFNSIK